MARPRKALRDPDRRTLAPHAPIVLEPLAEGEEHHAPPPPTDWHPIALQWYLALKRDAVAQLYGPADWAVAITAGQVLHDYQAVTPGNRLKAALMTQFRLLLDELFATPAARRKFRIEVREHREDEATTPDNIEDLKKRFFG